VPFRPRAFVAAVAILLQNVVAHGIERELVLRSGNAQVDLIELYTSEGCSSCPPADRWLASLESSSGLWHKFVPLGLHVDYWNALGWPDRFSSAAWSDRQREHAGAGHVSTVYTPGVFRNGREWRGWRSSAASPRAAVPGELEARILGSNVVVKFAAREPIRAPLEAHVALLGAGFSTAVQAGENRGRRLEHGFVVLGLNSRALAATGATLRLPDSPLTPPRRAVAVWVTPVDDLTPLQATGGWLQ
jgi:hypothetical protein